MVVFLMILILLVLFFFLGKIASNIEKQTMAIYSLTADLKFSLERLETIEDSINHIHPDIFEIGAGIKRTYEAIEENKYHEQTIKVLYEISSEISSTKDKIESIYLSR